MKYNSKSHQIKKLIESLMSDGKTHTVEEISSLAIERKIIADKGDAAIKNTLYLMRKNNPNFLNEGKGKYRMNKENNGEGTNMDMFERSLNEVLKEINSLRNFDWINCTDREWMQAREKISQLKKAYVEMQKLIG